MKWIAPLARGEISDAKDRASCEKSQCDVPAGTRRGNPAAGSVVLGDACDETIRARARHSIHCRQREGMIRCMLRATRVLISAGHGRRSKRDEQGCFESEMKTGAAIVIVCFGGGRRSSLLYGRGMNQENGGKCGRYAPPRERCQHQRANDSLLHSHAHQTL